MKYLNDGEVKALNEASALFVKASALLQECAFGLLMASADSKSETLMRAYEKIHAIEEQLNGVNYSILTVQPEWMGGGGDSATWKNRAPHGLNKF